MKKIYTIIFMTCIVLVAHTQDLDFEWAKQMGGSGFNSGHSITTDAAGNIYTTGYFTETVDLDPGAGVQNFTSTGITDIFIQKLDPEGNFLWAKQMGGSSYDQGYSITTDADGNVYTIGYFSETVDLDPGAGVQNFTSAGYYDIFIQKLDANGNFLWTKQMEGTYQGLGYSITTDGNGHIYTTGAFRGIMDFDPGPNVQNLNANVNYNIFIQKLDINGNFIWAKQTGGTYNDFGHSITTDVSGHVLVTGSLGTSTLSSSVIFIQKLDTNGNLLWEKQMGASSKNNNGNAITTDANGYVYTTGSFEGIIGFNPGPDIYSFTSEGYKDTFIQKLDANGNFIWAKKMGGANQDIGHSIIVNATGQIYTTGFFQGTVDFNPGLDIENFTSAGSSDIFIQKLDANGNFLWVKQMGSSAFDTGISSRIDAVGNIYTTGYFSGMADFDPGIGIQNLTPLGSGDIFIQKLSPCRFTSTDTQTACNAYIWIDGNTYTENNSLATYNIIGGAANGCDSLVTLNLTINSVSDITTSVNNATISANNSNATYQWLDCNSNYTPVPDETNQNFTATANGNYAVELTENNCTDTSACVLITTVNLFENSLSDKFVLYPNPTAGKFAIEFDQIQKNLRVRLLSISGQLILNKNFQNTDFIQLEINHPDGIYLLEILDDAGNRAALKLLKE